MYKPLVTTNEVQMSRSLSISVTTLPRRIFLHEQTIKLKVPLEDCFVTIATYAYCKYVCDEFYFTHNWHNYRYIVWCHACFCLSTHVWQVGYSHLLLKLWVICTVSQLTINIKNEKGLSMPAHLLQHVALTKGWLNCSVHIALLNYD